MSRPAILLDRDGTVVHARHYPSRPEELVLYDGLTDGLAEMKAAGYALVLITNQSGIARGIFTIDALHRMHDRLCADLAAAGAALDGIFFCPHHTDGNLPAYAIDCDCRKPRPGMLLQAARDLDLDLDRSWFVGDILDDVEAGNRAGCRTLLVDLGTESEPSDPVRMPRFVARSTRHALQIIQFLDGHGAPADLTYRPDGWRASAGEAVAYASEPRRRP